MTTLFDIILEAKKTSESKSADQTNVESSIQKDKRKLRDLIQLEKIFVKTHKDSLTNPYMASGLRRLRVDINILKKKLKGN